MKPFFTEEDFKKAFDSDSDKPLCQEMADDANAKVQPVLEENARLKAELIEAGEIVLDVKKTIRDLNWELKEIGEANATFHKVREENEALQTRLAAAEEALKEFSLTGMHVTSECIGQGHPCDCGLLKARAYFEKYGDRP